MATPKASREQWVLRGRTISKRYSFYGLGDRWSGHSVQIEIEFKPSQITRILEPGFKFIFRPSPLSDWEDGHLDARVTFADEAEDASPMMLVEIHNTADRALIVSSTQAKDAEVFVDNLCSGRDLTFIIQDGDERLLELPVPNDHQVYELIRRAML